MAHILSERQMSSEDPLVTKYPNLIYTASNLLCMKIPNTKESMITKWAAWVSGTQLCGYLLSILGWILCVTSTATDQWRIWRVEDVTGIPSGLVWIGIWKICYMRGTDPKNTVFRCEEFNEEFTTLPKEIFLAQDLMSLGCIMGAVAICFMTFALWNVFKTITQKTFLLTFFTLGGVLNLLSGIVLFIPISWNLHSILHQKTIEFHNNFPMPSLSPKDQWAGTAIHLGYVAAVLFLLSSFLILCNKYTLQRSEEKFSTLEIQPITAGVSSKLCVTCASSVAINIENKVLPDSSANELSSISIVDMNKCISESVQSQLSEKVNSHPIILVTPCK